MYYAIVDALDEIGADSSDVRVAWHTPNFVLDGYTITAANAEDGAPLKSMLLTEKPPTPHISTMTANGSFRTKALPL